MSIVTIEPQLIPFFLAFATPRAHADLVGSFMSHSSNVSISFLHASDLHGFNHFAPSLSGMQVSSISNCCSTTLQHRMSALCLEKRSWLRWSTLLMASSCSSVFFLLNVPLQVVQVRQGCPCLIARVWTFLESSNSSRVHHLSLT